MTLYNEMTADELMREIDRMRREIEIRKDQGLPNAVNVLQQKMNMAISYLNQNHIHIEEGKNYDVQGMSGTFHVAFIRGIMAWGTFLEDGPEAEEQALPINLLQRKLL